MEATQQETKQAKPSTTTWHSETDQQLLDRHREGNVRGIEGETFWCKMDELYNYLKKRNLI